MTDTTASTPAQPDAPARKNDRVVWIDCEMTGLELGHDALVEIAAIVTDSDLNELDAGIDLVIRTDAEKLAGMPDIVRQMHTASGLITEIPSGLELDDAAAQVLAYVKSHVPEARKAPLAGSSVYVDRGFIARDMPELDAYLHYRLIDVSTLKELARRWYPRAFFASPPKNGGHRALADIRESIAELRYYRAAVMVPAPGPDSAALAPLTAEHIVTHI